MKSCNICGVPMTEEQDPYGTGDWCFVLYEPNCSCPDGETEEIEEDYDDETPIH